MHQTLRRVIVTADALNCPRAIVDWAEY